jgi:hypothetical protein
VSKPEEPLPVGVAVHSTPTRISAIKLKSLEYESDHGLLKDCAGRFGWKNAGKPCPEPEWTPRVQAPVSHTMDSQVKVRLSLAENAAAVQSIRGAGPHGMTFPPQNLALPPAAPDIVLASDRRLGKKIQRLDFSVRW